MRWLKASSYTVKYLRISSYIRKPFLIYDFELIPFEFPYIWGKFRCQCRVSFTPHIILPQQSSLCNVNNWNWGFIFSKHSDFLAFDRFKLHFLAFFNKEFVWEHYSMEQEKNNFCNSSKLWNRSYKCTYWSTVASVTVLRCSN